MDELLGEPCVVGCPSGSLSLQIAASKTGGPSQTIVAKVAETASLTNFDFSTLAPADL